MTETKRHVLMIDNYDSFTWNLYQYLSQSDKCGKVDVVRNDEISISGIEAMNPDIIFISPGPGHPSTDAGICKDAIRHFAGIKPVFGVCMGQQCMYEVFGGDVGYAGEIMHGKTTTIKHDGIGMFENVPQSIAVTRYHSLAGHVQTLPDELEITATTETEVPIIMGVRHRKYTVEGVQFHPESILTQSGQLMIDNILSIHGGTWEENAKYHATFTPTTKEKKNILQRIYDQRKLDYEKIESLPGKSFGDLETTLQMGIAPPVINFYERLTKDNKGLTPILAEFKRASPSKGDINITAHPAKQGLSYASNGCATISVLTEPNWFKGSLEDLELIRRVVDSQKNRPAILRKEFIFSKYQIAEARLAGADTVLLIVKMLEPDLLAQLYDYSLSLNMVPLVEVNDEKELTIAMQLGHVNVDPLVIGVNNRNLTTFDVDLNTTSSLVKHAKTRSNVLVLALSGITSVEDVKKYKYEDGVDGFLIGESLMRAEEKGILGEYLHELTHC